ncbi:MAG: glycoside hydrolase family 3 C-terminal domain-containing protein [Lachnospiraceae bacterium]|nr:glycoside hydrolase family 3 C-terminal domain-containing protein [Lachnospiraceae bacterium]
MSDYLNTPLWNNQLSIDERLDYLVKELSIDEKLECLTTGCPDVPRLGIKEYRLGGEASHGVEARNDQAFNRGEPYPTTSFTQPVGMSGSFDKDLITECGRIIGDEARALQTKIKNRGLSRWAPTVDMARDPRWGRTEEAYGEDPYLAGEMASGLIKGMKGDDSFYIKCAATLKHFYANNVESNRSTGSSSIDNRNKHEYYFEPFRKAVVEGGAEGIMAAYNEINGVPAILNDEIQKIAKDEWGLSGHVVSDAADLEQTVTAHKFFETHEESIAAALKAGVDSFPDNKREMVISAGRNALDKGLITEADLDRSIRNTFRTRIRLGLFDNDCPYLDISEDLRNCKEHQEIALKMAKASIVLLKNEDNMLPLKNNLTEGMVPPKIAVIGPLADVWNKDWYCPLPPYTVSPLEGIRAEYQDSEITYSSGLNEVKIICGGRFIGLDENARLYMTSSENAENFTVNDWGSGSVTFKAKSNGLYVTIDDETGVISATKETVFDWFVREVWQIEDIIETNTSRKLSLSSGMVNFHFKSWNGKPVVIGEDNYLMVGDKDDESARNLVFSKITVLDGIKEAVNVAYDADYVFAFVGTNPVINSKETIDRTTLSLAPHQQLLAERLAMANPNTVLTIISNYPHTLGKLSDMVTTILYSATGSQDLGTAIAQTISGRSNPAGRLSMTWFKQDSDLPDIFDYDIIKGNRTYQYFDKEVLYPFGHGLSYSRFTYTNFTAVLNEKEQAVDISMTVRNSGFSQADEVIQIYVRKENSRAKQPLKQLKAFKRENQFSPGERRELNFRIPLADLRYFDVVSEKMVLEAGDYIFKAGASSLDIRSEMSVRIPGEVIKTRCPDSYTKALNYDDYRNVELYRGPQNEDGGYKTCVAPKAAPHAAGRYSSCKIIYNDFLFTEVPRFIKADVLPQEVCKLVIYNNMTMIATEDFSAESEFITKEAAINPDKIILNEKVSVQIQIYGNMKILGFKFE